MNLARDIATTVLLLGGCMLVLVAAVGLQRFDDVLARIHPATKAITLGAGFALLGAALQMPEPGAALKLLLTATLQLLTAPIAAHMVARAAYRTDPATRQGLEVDELATVTVDDKDADGDLL